MDLKQQLLAACAPPSKDVVVRGVPFRLVGLGASDQIKLSEMADEDAEDTDVTFWLLERMIRDGEGNRVFTDDDPALRALDFRALSELGDHAIPLIQDADETAKNSEAVQPSGD